MIRINLLPVRQTARRESSKQILYLFGFALLGLVGALFYVQSDQESKLGEIRKRNKTIQTKLTKLKEKTKAVATLQRQKEELEKQKNVLDTLIEGQSGPVKMLDELGQMLTPLEGAESRVAAESKGWNPDWDPNRLWIDDFQEKQRGIKITGHARTNEDLAEFLHRLGQSRHFVNISLNISESVKLTALDNTKFVKFNVDGLVIYGPADVTRLAQGKLGPAKKGRRRH